MGLSIDKNVQQIAFREHKSKDMSIPNQPVKTQSSYKGVDVLMGLTAIASTVIAGIALHNNNVLKKELKTVSNKLTEAEKTIQEINSSSQIKRKLTVIPEYFSEKNLGKHTAQVFIGTPEECACQKKDTLTVILVFI